MSTPNAHHELATTRYALLKHQTQEFCSAFLDLSSNPPPQLLKQHFTPSGPKITEHGPSWAKQRLPFLGKTFTGRDECLHYFDLLSKTLKFTANDDTFPGETGIVVDPQATASADGRTHAGSGKGWDGRGIASVVGKARFEAIETGVDWEEQFIWRLSDFDEEGRIGHWEIWADPLSAWMAVGGEGVGTTDNPPTKGKEKSPNRTRVVPKKPSK